MHNTWFLANMLQYFGGLTPYFQLRVFHFVFLLFIQVCRGLHAAFICLTLGATAYDSNLKFTSPDKPKLAYSGKRTVIA
jgi:hypothetical protein